MKEEKKPPRITVSDDDELNICLEEIKNNCERATKLSRRAGLLSMIAIAINIARLVLIIIEAAIR